MKGERGEIHVVDGLSRVPQVWCTCHVGTLPCVHCSFLVSLNEREEAVARRPLQLPFSYTGMCKLSLHAFLRG